METTEAVTPSESSKLAEVLESLQRTLERQHSSPAPALSAPVKEEKPEKVWTTSELQALVDKGDINQAQMFEQIRKQDQKLVDEKIRKEREASDADQRVNAKIQEYVAVVSDLRDRDSDSYKRVQARYDDLVKEGDPPTLRTQLNALRMEFGADPRKLTESRERTKERKVTRETTGGGSGSSAKVEEWSDGPGWLGDLRPHYERAIAHGRYKGWEDPQLKKELTRLKPRLEAKS